MDEQTRDKIKIFVDTVGDAVKSASIALNIPEIIIMAQWAYESGWGQSRLAKDYNNYGGIKAGSGWSGKVVILGTDEKNHSEHIEASFRVYPNVQSYANDYVKLLSGARYRWVPGTQTIKDFAYALIESGYCQDSRDSYRNALESIAKRINEVEKLDDIA